MTDSYLLDALDEVHQAPYPVFSSAVESESFWSSRFDGWRSSDPTDLTLYPTIREAIEGMIQ